MSETKPPEPPAISVIIPTLNEAESVCATLESTQAGADVEIIVVDGGSSDGTAELAKEYGVRLVITAAGRARQVNAGALIANGDVFLFLHGDTCLPVGFDQHVREIMATPGNVAGAFRLAIEGGEIGLRIIERLANFRSRFFKLPYGDQAIFLRADLASTLKGAGV